MKSPLLLFHLLLVGLWLGCVLTEILFERALLGQGRDKESLLADLHLRVDRWVEVPAFLLVGLTGALLLPVAAPGPMLYTKIAFGLLAVAINVHCVRLVWQRSQAARALNWHEFERLDRLQHRWGAAVLASMLLAVAIGATLI